MKILRKPRDYKKGSDANLEDEEVLGVDVDAELFELLQVDGRAHDLRQQNQMSKQGLELRSSASMFSLLPLSHVQLVQCHKMIDVPDLMKLVA